MVEPSGTGAAPSDAQTIIRPLCPPSKASSGSNAEHPRHHTVTSAVAAQTRRRSGESRRAVVMRMLGS